MSTVAENFAGIKERMHAACVRAGRDPGEVRLVGVTKTVPIERVREGVIAGISILGENYVQEARGKIEALSDLDVSWHFIGHLQSNKAKVAAQLFSCIHTVDRQRLAEELDRQAQKLGRRMSVLIEVNIGNEETKSGVPAENLLSLFQSVSSLDGLKVKGLMAMPPFLDPEDVRPYFRQLRHMLEHLRQNAPEPASLAELSMGMSGDYEVAIEEGATLIRVGTALFGARSY